MTTEIAIEIEKSEVEAWDTEARSAEIELEAFELKRFDGGVAIVAVILPVITATLPFVTRMVLAQIAAKRHVKVKVDGVELQGLSASEAERILQKVYDRRPPE